MKLIALFRFNDIDEDKSIDLHSFKYAMEYIRDWNIDYGTEYQTIQDFNDGEEYYEIEAVILDENYSYLN